MLYSNKANANITDSTNCFTRTSRMKGKQFVFKKIEVFNSREGFHLYFLQTFSQSAHAAHGEDTECGCIKKSRRLR